MATKIYKGFKYISQIFAPKEREIEIGLPTDVKHVAHIGWDGPSANAGAPSWMNEFKTSSEYATSSIGNINEAMGSSPAVSTWSSQDYDAMESQPVSGKTSKGTTPKDLPNGPKKHRRKKVKPPSSPKSSSSPKKSSRKSKAKHTDNNPKPANLDMV